MNHLFLNKLVLDLEGKVSKENFNVKLERPIVKLGLRLAL